MGIMHYKQYLHRLTIYQFTQTTQVKNINTYQFTINTCCVTFIET